MNTAIIWFAKNNLSKCIAEASKVNSLHHNTESLTISLFVLDRQNSTKTTSKKFINHNLFYIYKSSYLDSIFSDFCDVINFSNAKYILPVPDDDPIDYVSLLKMLNNFSKRKDPDKAIYIPVPSNPCDISVKLNYGKLTINSQYSFWEYMHDRATNIAFYSLLNSSHILKAYSMLNGLIFERYWFNPLWDQFFVWLLTYTDPQPSILCIDEFYLYYSNDNWSDKKSIKKSRNRYHSFLSNIEGSLVHLLLSIRVKVRPLEYIRWSLYLLKRSLIYFELFCFLGLLFKLIRLNFINLTKIR